MTIQKSRFVRKYTSYFDISSYPELINNYRYSEFTLTQHLVSGKPRDAEKWPSERICLTATYIYEDYEPCHGKACFTPYVNKVQVSLRIHIVWLAPLLFAS